MLWCGGMLPHHCIVHNDLLYRTFLTIVTLARLKYEGWNFNSSNYLFTTDTK